MQVSPSFPAQNASRPAARPAPVDARIRARGGDPLPSFGGPADYRNYVINLVGQAQSTQRELETARKQLNDGKEGSKLVVATLQERLDALKLQLKILRDDYPIPASWTRPRLFFGHGFDKEAFWRQQVEAIPGKEVMVPPAPSRPAPAPATAAPASTTTPVTPPGGTSPPAIAGLTPALQKLVLDYADQGLAGRYDRAGIAFSRSKLEAMLPILAGKDDPAARDAEAFVRWTVQNWPDNDAAAYDHYRIANRAVKALLGGAGELQARHDAAMLALANSGMEGRYDRAGIAHIRRLLRGIEKHATQGSGERSRAIAALAARALREHPDDDSAAYHAFKATFASCKGWLTGAGTLDERSAAVIGKLAEAGAGASYDRSGIAFMRHQLQAVARLTAGSADPKLQAIDGVVRQALATHKDNDSAAYNAFKSTFQAIQALRA